MSRITEVYRSPPGRAVISAHLEVDSLGAQPAVDLWARTIAGLGLALALWTTIAQRVDAGRARRGRVDADIGPTVVEINDVLTAAKQRPEALLTIWAPSLASRLENLSALANRTSDRKLRGLLRRYADEVLRARGASQPQDETGAMTLTDLRSRHVDAARETGKVVLDRLDSLARKQP
jgi:hypothetical protein